MASTRLKEEEFPVIWMSDPNALKTDYHHPLTEEPVFRPVPISQISTLSKIKAEQGWRKGTTLLEGVSWRWERDLRADLQNRYQSPHYDHDLCCPQFPVFALANKKKTSSTTKFTTSLSSPPPLRYTPPQQQHHHYHHHYCRYRYYCHYATTDASTTVNAAATTTYLHCNYTTAKAESATTQRALHHVEKHSKPNFSGHTKSTAKTI
ncbi:hypothetical protein QR685DRAFT_540518 [Neurospora intermedia]|uniref:Uncharacterized protein n=1 Tax=Neurospora intermedia TaxID=5142 RepID=A0ABR3DR52_NEUIN